VLPFVIHAVHLCYDDIVYCVYTDISTDKGTDGGRLYAEERQPLWAAKPINLGDVYQRVRADKDRDNRQQVHVMYDV